MPAQVLVAAATGFQLRVCTGKVCKKQGSPQIAQFGKDLGLRAVDVQTCGCLGMCGNGPNVAVIPLDGTQPLLLRHVCSQQRMGDLLRNVCSQQVDDALLKATELRLAGNAAAQSGNLQRAVQLYTQGIDLQAPTGRHLLLSNRSGVRLEMGDAEGALQDANAAAECSPPDFTNAAIRQVEALLRLAQYRGAMECLLAARERHPSWGQSNEYRRCVADVQRALETADPKVLT